MSEGPAPFRRLAGRPVSPWLDDSDGEELPPLERDLRVDVVVVGGGIVGVTAALLLQHEGADVALLEGRRIGAGTTGNTTAKLSSLHGLTYGRLATRYGGEVAQAYGEANQRGLSTIASLVADLEIDCDFRRKPNLTYAEDARHRPQIEDEAEAARAAGLPASFDSSTDLPFAVAAAVRFDNQAEFHPWRYLSGLVAALLRGGAPIFERSRVVGIDGTRVVTSAGPVVAADHVILATHLPFQDRGLFFARTHPERSYALGVRVAGPTPQAMYLSTESPAHSLRVHPRGAGDLLIVAGESHRAGAGDPVERFLALERYARERFDVKTIEYRWSAHDHMPVDGLPYVGRLWPLSGRILTVTGLRKWGLAMGVTAAAMLVDKVLDRGNDLAETFDTGRLHVAASAPEVLRHSVHSGQHFFFDRFLKRRGASRLAVGEGKVIRSGLGQAAVCRDEKGRLHSVSARCTHLGCIVDWNAAELTWDCPCHGSRFSPRGEVLSGPAVEPLATKS